MWISPKHTFKIPWGSLPLTSILWVPTRAACQPTTPCSYKLQVALRVLFHKVWTPRRGNRASEVTGLLSQYLIDRQPLNPTGLVTMQKPPSGTKSRVVFYIVSRSPPPPHELSYQRSTHTHRQNRNDTDFGKYTRISPYKSPQRHSSHLVPALLQNTLRFLFITAYKHTSKSKHQDSFLQWVRWLRDLWAIPVKAWGYQLWTSRWMSTPAWRFGGFFLPSLLERQCIY